MTSGKSDLDKLIKSGNLYDAKAKVVALQEQLAKLQQGTQQYNDILSNLKKAEAETAKTTKIILDNIAKASEALLKSQTGKDTNQLTADEFKKALIDLGIYTPKNAQSDRYIDNVIKNGIDLKVPELATTYFAAKAYKDIDINKLTDLLGKGQSSDTIADIKNLMQAGGTVTSKQSKYTAPYTSVFQKLTQSGGSSGTSGSNNSGGNSNNNKQGKLVRVIITGFSSGALASLNSLKFGNGSTKDPDEEDKKERKRLQSFGSYLVGLFEQSKFGQLIKGSLVDLVTALIIWIKMQNKRDPMKASPWSIAGGVVTGGLLSKLFLGPAIKTLFSDIKFAVEAFVGKAATAAEALGVIGDAFKTFGKLIGKIAAAVGLVFSTFESIKYGKQGRTKQMWSSIGEAVGSAMMLIAPLTGPAAPYLAVIGLVLTIICGILTAVFNFLERKDARERELAKQNGVYNRLFGPNAETKPVDIGIIEKGQQFGAGIFNNAVVTSKAGKRDVVEGSKGKLISGDHGNAIDFAQGIGKDVKAIYGGKVSAVNDKDTGKAGVYVKITDILGHTETYAHLQEPKDGDNKKLPKVGDIVSAGTVIGLEGETGNVTGPHTHYAVKGMDVNANIIFASKYFDEQIEDSKLTDFAKKKNLRTPRDIAYYAVDKKETNRDKYLLSPIDKSEKTGIGGLTDILKEQTSK